MSEAENYGVAIGEPDYGGGGNNWKVQGKGVDNVFRILPPLGELAAEGVWNCGHAGHWGYENSEKKPRLFKCLEKKNPETKMIVQMCPECTEHIAKIKNERDTKFQGAVAYLMKEKGMPKEAAEQVANGKLKGYDEQLRRFNRSFRIYVNAINEKEEIGVLNMAFKHLMLLKTLMAKLKKDGIDPLGIKGGVWFNFQYSTGQDHTVEPVFVGSVSEGQRLKPAALSVNVLKRLKNEACLNLASAWDAARLRELSEDQVRTLAKSNGDPTVVDSIFSRGDRSKTPQGTLEVPTDDSLDNIPGFEDVPKTAAPSQQTAKSEQPQPGPLSPPASDKIVQGDDFDKIFDNM